jgi:hypothetical protein
MTRGHPAHVRQGLLAEVAEFPKIQPPSLQEFCNFSHVPHDPARAITRLENSASSG